ncbi:MAG TPA: sigma-70 family RNA polymerase sigma factor [Gemmata sp.]
MSRTLLLHAIARKAESLIPDADLLARFTHDRDQPAFEELVRRHGPLVWAVCRHLLADHADAEDAFQAVFLALVRSGASIRDGHALPGWLHGVAVRIATRAKRECARRKARERAAARPEAARPVSEGTWGALVAAAHEEIQKLPDAERTAFVLCDLEGVSQPDAAARLGWPLGSLSGRLCKARQRLLERLAARGIAPAVAIGIGLTAGGASALPEKLFDVVKVFPGTPGAASAAVRGLTGTLTGGVTMRTKVLATATVLVAAIGLTGGAALMSQADAQPSLPGGGTARPPGSGSNTSGPTTGASTGGALLGAPGQPGMSPGGAGTGPVGMPGMMGGFSGVHTPPVDYKFVDIKTDRKAFEQTISQQGKEGWEFCGSERFGQTELTLVFKKAKSAVTGGGFGGVGTLGGGGFGRAGGGGGGFGGTVPLGPGTVPPGAFPTPAGGDNVFQVVPLKSASADDVVKALQKQFENKNLRAVAERAANAVVIVSGDKDVIKSALKAIAELDAKAAKSNALLNVFNLKNSSAEEMVTVLKKLYPNAEMTADPRTNTIIARGDEKNIEELRLLIARLDSLESVKPK